MIAKGHAFEHTAALKRTVADRPESRWKRDASEMNTFIKSKAADLCQPLGKIRPRDGTAPEKRPVPHACQRRREGHAAQTDTAAERVFADFRNALRDHDRGKVLIPAERLPADHPHGHAAKRIGNRNIRLSAVIPGNGRISHIAFVRINRIDPLSLSEIHGINRRHCRFLFGSHGWRRRTENEQRQQ